MPPMHARQIPTLFLAVAAAVLLSACSPISRPYRLNSMQSQAELRPSLPLQVYTSADGDTFDVYLSDLPASALRPGASLAGLSGHLIRIHVFVIPRAGRTPIDAEAFNAAITHAIVSGGQVGVYAGGGFVVPEDSVGASEIRARIAGGTVRLESGTGGFQDRLGPSNVAGSVRATRNASAAESAKARLDELIQMSRSGGSAAPGSDAGGTGG